MSLDLAFGIARSGLAAVSRGLGQTAQNISNAETPGYTRKTVPQEALVVLDQPNGVRAGEAQRNVDAALVGRLDLARADEAAGALRETLLRPIEDLQGAPADGITLADGFGDLENGFTALRASPADAGLQRAVLDDATELARRFQALAGAVGGARQEAQAAIVQGVADANDALRDIAALTDRLKGGADGQTAALEDERDLAIARLAEVLEVRAVRQPGGDLVLVAGGGIVLPLDPRRDAFRTDPAWTAPGAFYGGGGTLPGVTLNGLDVTTQLRGGRLAEAIELRDRTLPRYQAELDLAAANLAGRLDQQGLRLFTDGNGTVPNTAVAYPASQTLGFAERIRVNAAVLGDPALLRDGTQAVTAVPGGPTAFAPNPPGGPAGFTTLLDRVLNFSFGSQAAAGAPWAAIQTSGLGPDGSLASPFLAPATTRDYAARLTAVYAADRAEATATKDAAAGLRTALGARFAQQSGVDVDAELAQLVALQNAYAANARVLTTVQTAWDALLGAVR